MDERNVQLFAGLLGGATDAISAADDLGVRSLWPMRYAMHEQRRGRRPTLRRRPGLRALLAANDDVVGAIEAPGSDEVLYVLDGMGLLSSTGRRTSSARAPRSSSHATCPGSSTARCAPSRCCVHDAEPSSVSHAVVDLDEVETGTATAGRQFLLGVTPEQGCASVTQFIGLVPPGRRRITSTPTTR